MHVTNFQSAKSCDWSTKNPAAQTPLTGYFVPDTQRDPKNAFLLRGKPPYALPPNVANPPILQKAQAALHESEAREGSRLQQQEKFLTPRKKIQEVDMLQKFRFCN